MWNKFKRISTTTSTWTNANECIWEHAVRVGATANVYVRGANLAESTGALVAVEDLHLHRDSVVATRAENTPGEEARLLQTSPRDCEAIVVR